MKFRHGRVPSAQSRAQHTFSKVPTANIPRSSFDRSHCYKSTFNEGYLIPVYLDEVLPGDTFNVRITAFARLATLIEPIMDNMFMDVHFFFVPNRLVWSNWERFNGAQDNPSDSTSFLIPVLDDTTAPLSTTGFLSNSIFDYFGLPTLIASGGAGQVKISALPFRGLNLIWNDWYRDQNLQNSLTVSLTDGPDNCNLYTLQRRGKRHDYFTSCLPWPQKVNDGSTLNVPLTGTAAVFSVQNSPAWGVNEAGTATPVPGGPIALNSSSGILNATGVANAYLNIPVGGAYADLTTASGVTINELREAFQIQRMFERDARGGTRYIEIVKSHFNVDSPDARLQRPEFLGSASSSWNIHPVPQTSVSAATPQANLAAFGTLSLSGGFVKSFVEHGYIFGIVSTRADLNYQQGLHRSWSRQTRYDFFWPTLAHIGEQSVLNKEIYFQGDNVHDPAVFGYQERFGEYRYFPGQITGEFRSNFATPLDTWHLAQDFTALPTLGSTFIVENAPVARVIAASTAAHFLFDSYFSIKCARPMPVYGVPGLIDHF